MDRFGDFIVNNWYLFVALAVILFMLIYGELARRVLKFKEIKPVDAVRMMNHEGAVMLDVRDDKEWREGHVLNAVHLPLANLEARLGELEQHRGKPIIVYCRMGQRSARAATLLTKQGFNPVFKLGGGILSWTGAGMPLTKR